MDWLHMVWEYARKKKMNPHNSKQFLSCLSPYLALHRKWMNEIVIRKSESEQAKNRGIMTTKVHTFYSLQTLCIWICRILHTVYILSYTIYTQYESVVRGMEVSVKSTTIPVKQHIDHIRLSWCCCLFVCFLFSFFFNSLFSFRLFLLPLLFSLSVQYSFSYVHRKLLAWITEISHFSYAALLNVCACVPECSDLNRIQFFFFGMKKLIVSQTVDMHWYHLFHSGLFHFVSVFVFFFFLFFRRTLYFHWNWLVTSAKWMCKFLIADRRKSNFFAQFTDNSQVSISAWNRVCTVYIFRIFHLPFHWLLSYWKRNEICGSHRIYGRKR